MRRPGKRSKFGVRIDKVGKLERTVDGHVFASKKEAKRYHELRLLEKAGKIRRLECQPRFDLHVKDQSVEPPPLIKIGTYVADFSYRRHGDMQRVVEDVKSPATRTALYKWKIKHLRAEHGITIVEV